MDIVIIGTMDQKQPSMKIFCTFDKGCLIVSIRVILGPLHGKFSPFSIVIVPISNRSTGNASLELSCIGHSIQGKAPAAAPAPDAYPIRVYITL